MKNLHLLRYFTLYSLIAFVFTGASLLLFINRHMINSQINSMERVTHLAIDYIVEPELSTNDYKTTLSKEKFYVLDLKLNHITESEDILSTKIWNTSNSVIYSKNSNVIEKKIT